MAGVGCWGGGVDSGGGHWKQAERHGQGRGGGSVLAVGRGAVQVCATTLQGGQSLVASQAPD
ncbi:hypothetical protein B1218_36160 [Pseudomonas ogarae]|nr:hypothetical protein B1218_36160 [Pseudomonas ogarae]